MPDDNLIKLVRRNLLTILRASVGSTMFQHVYVRRKSDGQEIDAMNGGELSCALFVSSILAPLDLIDRAHATVTTVIEKLKESGWYVIESPRPGAIAFYPPQTDEQVDHLAFVLSDQEYISHNSYNLVPAIHTQRLRDGRVPTVYYWHDSLNID